MLRAYMQVRRPALLLTTAERGAAFRVTQQIV
jgi:hypothetical protein